MASEPMTSEEIRAEATERVAKAMWTMRPDREIPCPWEDAEPVKQWAYTHRAALIVTALGDMLPTGEVWGCRYRGWALAVDAFDDESQARQHVATRPQDELVRTWSHEWIEVTG